MNINAGKVLWDRSCQGWLSDEIGDIRLQLDRFLERKLFNLLNEKKEFFREGYLYLYPDVAKKKINPWIHYLFIGRREGRSNGSSPESFSKEQYLYLNKDLSNSEVDLWKHWVCHGYKEGRCSSFVELIRKSPYFDCIWYSKKYNIPQDNCAEHYCFTGYRLGYDPSEFFSTNFYLERYNDVRRMGINPLVHYLINGGGEWRLPIDTHDLCEIVNPGNEYFIDKNSFYSERKVPEVTIDTFEDAILIVLTEHIGDIVAAEPIVRYLKSKYNERKLVWVINKKYKELIEFNGYLDGIITVETISEAYKLFRKIKNQKVVNLHFNFRPCENGVWWPNHNNLINFKNYCIGQCLLASFSKLAGLPALYDEPIFWHDKKRFSKINIDKYVVIHCKSNDSTKDWDDIKFNELAEKIINDGYCVVEIGLEQVIKIRTDRYINYTGRKSFHEIYDLIEKCNCFVGVDSCFMHFANAAKVRAVGIFGTLNNMYCYNPYSGRYWKGEGITFVVAKYPMVTSFVEVNEVYEAVKNIYSHLRNPYKLL